MLVKKISCIFLSVGILVAGISSSLNLDNYASASEENVNVNNDYIFKEDYDYLKQDRSIWTKVAKKAIRTALRNKGKIVNLVENIAGEDAAAVTSRYFSVIADAIEPLLELTEIPAQMVYDVVYNALRSVNVDSGMASSIALAIREIVSWML